MTTHIRPSSCGECRHGTIKTKKIKGRMDPKSGEQQYKLIPIYHCGYKNLTNSVDQTQCEDYVGEMTIFEYLMMTQPDEVNKLLTTMGMQVVGSRNKWGFDFK